MIFSTALAHDYFRCLLRWPRQDAPQSKAYLNGLTRGFGGPLGQSLTSPHTRVYEFLWNPTQVNSDPRRDIIGIARVTTNNRWPLEIAFYVKHNGKMPLGEVEALTRPATKTKTAPPD